MADGSHIAIDARSLELLEFAQIQARLAGHASFEGGTALALALTPSADPPEVRRRRRETEQAVRLEERAVTGPGGAFDMRDGIGLVERGGVLDVAGLERIDATIAVAVEVRAEVAAHRELAPDLADRLWTGIQPMALAGLAAALERTLDHRGGILDTASPELADCRRRLAAARRDGVDLLRRLAGRLGAHLQETFTTERGGRPVLAVKASSRSAVPGIVHDTSASGGTLFIEPLELVDANNRLRELEAMEAAELERILAELSERVRQVADGLVAAIAALAAHDLALASARLSYDWDGCPVDDAPEPELLGARHPLLDPRRAVPIDLDLRGIRALVISGPNTGGKTVALKTLGMLAALSQCGLRLPARAARLPVFDVILADIGDEQSIALNLSTFSAHVRRLSEIIEAAGSRSLVLLDEIAAGTDPDEGGPLAQAIIERLVGAGARVLVTTHLGSLKEWAVGFAGAENAAVAIDPATLRPRYAINIGSYGASHALDIAESLGLPDAVTAAARAAMSPARQQSDALIRAAGQAQAQAEADLAAARAERAAATAARREAERVRAELETRVARHRERLQADRDEVRAQARRDLAAASAELAELRGQIRAARRSEARRRSAVGVGAGADELRARDRSLAAATDAERRAGQALSDAPAIDAEPVAVGNAVRDPTMGFRGVVVAVEGDVAVVQGDRARMRIPVTRLIGDARTQRPVPAAPPSEIRPPVVAAPEQIDVRGQRAAEACARVRAAVDAAAVAGRPRLLVIHGIGTGALRAAVREELLRHPLVDKVDPAPAKEGGDGATYAVLESR
jgi:DNA mismatch repair protein MutS2